MKQASPEIIATKKGQFTLVWEGKLLHSKIDPGTEANKWVEHQQFGSADVLVIHEAGLGYIIPPLLEKIHSEHSKTEKLDLKAILFINERRNLFSIGVEKGVFSQVLDCTYPVFLLDPDSAETIWRQLETIGLETSKGYKVLRSPVPPAGERLLQIFLKLFSSKLSDLLTRVEFEKQWIHNMIQNISSLNKGKPILSMPSAQPHSAAVIVGAGPTLIEHIDLLKQLRDSTFLVATDTALLALLAHGITPDAVYTLDSQNHSIKHFLPALAQWPEECQKIHLIADLVSSPAISRHWPGPIWFANTAKYTYIDNQEIRESTPFSSWIENRVGRLGDTQSGGSVATSAFDLVRQLGFATVIFVGQDLAYVGREIHTRGTHHNQGWLPLLTRLQNLEQINQLVITKRSIKWIPTLESALTQSGKTVISDYVFDLYRNWFNDAFTRTGLNILFPVSQGARFEGVQILPAHNIPGKIRPDLGKKYRDQLRNSWQTQNPIQTTMMRDSLNSLRADIANLYTRLQACSDGECLRALMQGVDEQEIALEIFFRPLNLSLSRGKLHGNELKNSPLIHKTLEELRLFLNRITKQLALP